MTFALCIGMFFGGHVVRDGWPSWKDMLVGLVGTRWEWLYHLSTQFARVSGALLCGLGAALVGGSLFGLIVAGGILAGFYTDCRHGEAAGVDTPSAIADSFLSGVSSLLPLAVLLGLLIHPYAPLVILVGLLKPAIWKLAWLALGRLQDTWFQPTRIAAGTFGAAIGAAVAIVGS